MLAKPAGYSGHENLLRITSGFGFDDSLGLSHSIQNSDKPRNLILLYSRRQAYSYSNWTTLLKGSYRGKREVHE